MNLAFKYPIIFWNCANLIVDSGAYSNDADNDELSDDDDDDSAAVEESNESDEDDEDDEDEEAGPAKKKVATKTVNYGKISTAIGRMRQYGINVMLPDINESKYRFSVDVEHNLIRYGIKGITRIGDALVKDIIANRPYSSIEDFMNKVKVTKVHMVNLIKSGCFDSIAGSRAEAMDKYICQIADTKSKLTLQNMPGLIREDLIPDEMAFFKQVFLFNKYLKDHKSGIYYLMNSHDVDFYNTFWDSSLIVQDTNPAVYQISQKDWDKIYKKAMDPMREYLKNPENGMLEKVNNRAMDAVKDKYARGSISKWEMDSVGFYYGDHELKQYYDKGAISVYPLTSFAQLSEEPEVAYMVQSKTGGSIPIYKLNYIAGTVISKDKIHHSVTLLTDCGVVNVKVWNAQFTKYDKQISAREDDGKKKVIEKSWFTRGNRLLVVGIRRGDSFIPKTYKSGKYMSTPIAKIEDDGRIVYLRADE